MRFNNTYHTTFSGLYHEQAPDPVAHPKLICYSPSVVELLGQTKEWPLSNEFLQIFSGHHVPEGAAPLAQKYTGHQFGYYNPDLGDGRGILLGELQGNGNETWDLHLKGAGKTPYSRQGDGRAVLRSSIREFLASEALYHLGIPTSRALCIIEGTDTVWRESCETSAMVTRVTESHIRFGHFEWLYHTNQHDELKQMMDYVIKHHYPDCIHDETPYLALYQSIVRTTAMMIAKWQAFGFCHGVMNTDNMSILGHTFDYGPYAFLDTYKPNFICNHSDEQGRYAFDQQPSIGLWNLNCLAHAFSNVLTIEQLRAALQQYETTLVAHYAELMRSKFGFKDEQKDDQALVGRFLNLLAENELDYSLSFRSLNEVDPNTDTIPSYLAAAVGIKSWLVDYKQRLISEGTGQAIHAERLVTMNKSNPKYILRNYLAHEAILAAQKGDHTRVEALHRLLLNPYDEQPEFDHYAQPAPTWSKKLAISCSS